MEIVDESKVNGEEENGAKCETYEAIDEMKAKR